ncbi:MAG: 2,4-dihydroxyhept-2-ene-1,7-dioic acid aldolase [Desulfovibrio sp.]|nr:2,4-dihydroxyhept-2-ene-1,7-dioic acid aldolase [Desulfovibrio sp.]
MHIGKDIRQSLRRGGLPVIGTWLQLPSPDVAELIARLGYDWAAADLEHGSFTRAQLPDVFRALERWGTLPFARLAAADMTMAKAALDSGARGLIFPMIESRRQLDDAIAWSLYPGGEEFAGGRRGVGFSRANAFGMDFAAHVDARNGIGHNVVIVAQIEHIKAMEDLDGIFSHPRLDAYMIGPYDLSASMGLTGRFEHPDFLAALAFIEQKAEAHSVSKGYHIVQPDEDNLRSTIARGYTFIAYGIDALFLQCGGKRPQA